MFEYKKLTFLVSLFMVGMLLLAACGAEETTPAPVEEAEDTQAMVEAAESSSENQVPTSKSEVPRISAEELKERLDNGEAIVVVDTRPTSTYDKKHIAGAITRPDSFDDIAHDQEIIAYCA